MSQIQKSELNYLVSFIRKSPKFYFRGGVIHCLKLSVKDILEIILKHLASNEAFQLHVLII
jgi:hypothetical protein